MSYSILIPIFNEAALIPKLIEDINFLIDKYEIIIIDDGSNDASKNLLTSTNNIKIIHNDKNYGKGYCIKRGLEIAKNENIILMDGDLEVSSRDIPKLIKEFESVENINKRAVVGVRWNSKNSLALTKLTKMMFGNILINEFFNRVFNTTFSDILCCYKILSKRNFRSLHLKSLGFSIETEIMSKLVLFDYEVREVKVWYSPRTARQGKKLKVKDGLNIFRTIVEQKMRSLLN